MKLPHELDPETRKYLEAAGSELVVSAVRRWYHPHLPGQIFTTEKAVEMQRFMHFVIG